MAFTIPKPPFPNVPKLPGVPQLSRSPQFPAGPPPLVSAVIAGARLFQAFFAQPVWGIYKHQDPQPAVQNGIETVTATAVRRPVIEPDSFLEFDFQNEYSISDYPVQDGGFANFNKVANPFETRLRMSKGGSQDVRKKFLDSCDAIQGTLDFYDILTPEKTYLNCNVLRFELARKGAQGAAFFADVDIYFREIRTVTQTYSTTATNTQNAQNPSAEPPVNVGTVQGTAAPAAITPASQDIPSPGP